MLVDFEEAKRELSAIKHEVLAYSDDNSPAMDARREFLKARVRDILKSIYRDSPATLDSIDKLLQAGRDDDMVMIVNRALEVPLPLHRALGSEDDGRTLQALVDAAVWRSRFVWAAAIITLASVTIALVLLGVNVTGLNKQADAARQFLQEAQTNTQDTMRKLTEGLSSLSQMTKDFEEKRAKISERIDRLDSPDSEISKLTARFVGEIARLDALEHDWAAQREKLAAALSQHDGFLAGRESDILRKTADFNRSVDEATGNAKRIDDLVDPSKRQAAIITDSSTDAATKLGTITRLSDLAAPAWEKTGKTLADIQREAEAAQGRISGTELKVAAAQTAVEGSARNVSAAQEQFAKSLEVSQKQGDAHIRMIGTLVDSATGRSSELSDIVQKIATDKTALITTLENLKTQQQTLKGEGDRLERRFQRIDEITKVVDEKNTETVQKLQVLLDQRPSFDAAAILKLIWAETVLRLLFIGTALLLLVFVAWLAVLSFRRRPASVAPSGRPGAP